MTTVLISGAGGAGGIGALRSLHQTTGHELVGIDMDPYAAGLSLADAGETVPVADADDWPEAVARVIRRHDVDVLVPTVDEELPRLPELGSVAPDLGIVTPTQDVVDIALDKYRTSTVLDTAGHHVPDTWLGSEADVIPREAYPCIGKPRAGRGSRGIKRLGGPEEVERFVSEADDPDRIVVQELIEGTEFTTSVVVTGDGRLLETVPKEAIEKRGSTVRGVTRRQPAVAESCEAISRTLEPAGPINVQQILDEEGTAYTIEINPRFSSTACLTVAAGVDELDLLIRDAANETVESSGGYEAGVMIRRYPDHVFFREDSADVSKNESHPPAPDE